MRRAALVLTVLLASGTAMAQVKRPPRRPPLPLPPTVDVRMPAVRDAGKLRSRFGIAAGHRLVSAGDSESRVRGVRRLAAMGTAQAVDLLVRSQDAGSPVALDLRARLEAIRGLASHSGEDGPRQTLLNALADAARSQPGEDTELWPLVRDTAALALARHGGERGAEALAGLVRQGGMLGEAAGRALLAYPPAELPWIVGGRGAITPAIARLLADLGDLRAIDLLRRSVRQGDAETRAESLIALGRLGDAEAAPIARSWARVPDALAQVSAAKTLVQVSPAEGRALLAHLLVTQSTRDDALTLAAACPGAETTPALVEIAKTSAVETRRLAIVALGRSGDEAAVKALATLLLDPEVGTEAGLSLALSPGAGARQALEGALASPSSRAVALRAATVRALSLDDAPSSLARVATSALADPGAKAAAAFALVATRERAPDDPALLADPELLGAVARGAIGAGDRALVKLLPLLADAVEPRRRDALGAALLASPDGGSLATARLLAWVEEGSAVAALALRAVAARDDEPTRSILASLFASGDPVLRAHVALGLALSPEPDATGRLASAYGFETDTRVRRAIIRALSMRTEPVRRPTLALAAELDPDAEIRALARAATTTRLLLPRSTMVAWMVVEGDTAAGLRLWRADDVAVPVVPDTDGALLVPGLSMALARGNVAAFPSRRP